MKASTNAAELRREMARYKNALRISARYALDDVAFQARTDVQIEMRRVFDRPTPFVLRSVRVETTRRVKDTQAVVSRVMGVQFDKAATAYVFVDYPGGKAVDPNSVLMAEIEGGRRNDKRMERALQRLGVLNTGWQVVPASGLPADKIDAYGNVKGSFVVQIISYLQGFGEQGYRANMTAKRKAQLAKRGRSERGFVQIRGVEYFVSRGKGTWFGRRSWRGGMEQHLPPGIWQRSGIHGSNIKPVFLFVRRPAYRQRLDFEGVVLGTANREFEALLDWRMADMLGKA